MRRARIEVQGAGYYHGKMNCLSVPVSYGSNVTCAETIRIMAVATPLCRGGPRVGLANSGQTTRRQSAVTTATCHIANCCLCGPDLRVRVVDEVVFSHAAYYGRGSPQARQSFCQGVHVVLDWRATLCGAAAHESVA